MTVAGSGRFTFLLTDIEGSTRLWETAPAEMAKALQRHDEIVTAVVAAHGGDLVRTKGEGDSAFAVFEDVSVALRCAVELQRAITLEPWPPAAPIRVRMALHTGPAEARNGDYYGQGVNRAARLRAVAHGGQLVVSRDVRSVVESSLPPDTWLTDLGSHRLKDLSQPERIWQVGHPDLAADLPPLRSLEAAGHNLPVQLTTFVGREEELTMIRKRIETSRLLTLTGPGGIGKTRLALQAAADATDDFPDGVWLVEFAGVTDNDAIVAEVAEAVGVREEPAKELLRSVADDLAGRRSLLVFDNCEHVLEAVAQVVHELLTAAEGLRILATSREPLSVYGEAIYAVPTLEVPHADVAFPEEALASDAVRLFADRAALVDHDFTVGPHTDAVVGICRRLEGIPLAIELAAALVRTATTAEISERLSDRLGALAEGPRTAPQRHRTLRAAIDASYELLTDDERDVLTRVAVFAGGFTTDAAAAVSTTDEIDRHVRRLTDRSLVQMRTSAPHPRFLVLETIRDYVLERGDPEVLADAQARHTAWVLGFVEAAAGKLWSPQAAPTMASLTEEHDNIRAAVARAIDTDPDVAARIIAAMHVYWVNSGHLTEGREWSRRGRDAVDDPAMKVRLKLYEGQFLTTQGHPTAIPLIEESIAEGREIGQLEVVGLGLNVLAGTAIQGGRIAEAKQHASEALTLLRRVGQTRNVVQTLNVLGVVATLEGDESSAYALYEDALAVSREIGMTETIGRLLLNLGNLSLGRGDYVRAREQYEEARTLAAKVGDPVGASAALTNLGVVAKADGDYVEARRLLDEALELKRSFGDVRGIAIVLHGLAEVDRFERRYGRAHDLMLESISISQEIGFSMGVIQGIETANAILADAGGTDDCLRALAAADAAREANGLRRTPDDSAEFERLVESLMERIGADAGSIWDEGRKLSLDDALELTRRAHVATP